jgi:uncharacterized membrane protein
MGEKEEIVEHLKMVQTVISRMANTSFIIKGWAITVVSAILGFSLVTSSCLFGLIAIIPNIIFWLLDSYYLWQEKLFRKLYDQIRVQTKNDLCFSMDTSSCKKITMSWFRTMFTCTEWIVYISMLIFILVISLFC